ncbi:MAG: methyltransferase domain-containing protein [Bryobacteraceae bacterium]|jgi:SAM-dependent methyltransferase
MHPWHEDDEFWAALEAQLFDEARLQVAAAEVTHATGLLGLGAGARVLDLCCGLGRHSLELARWGCEVTGVDRTALYLGRARELAAAENLPIEFIQADMRAFRREGAFDGAISLFTSFGYFENPDEDLQVLRNLHASLRPGGRLAMQMAGKEVLARCFAPKDWIEYPDGSYFLVEREVAASWSGIHNRWIVIRGAERKVFDFTHRIYSAAELKGVLGEAGFSAVDVLGDLDGRPYDREAKCLVAVAAK